MKTKLLHALISLTVFTGCHSTKVSNLEDRVSTLEKTSTLESSDPNIQELILLLSSAPYHSRNEPNKNDVLITLGLINAKSAVPQIINIAKSSKDRNFRKEAYRVLGWLNDKRAINYLQNAAKHESYVHAKSAAEFALKTIEASEVEVNEQK
ncbi:HEAT repeat domain-containing protein [Lentisphaera marina]|uniref:HEAT repeat domain-containing protein n=1 Tax=Lentisphaera marina TaxID=1111041 RepID=UPI0023668CFD|nr:HEAT repeat domain-containing protein [Lentisphaera marina]MDD7985046.1 HEAT repeat domain-containing protein [Lentisphaera marina]